MPPRASIRNQNVGQLAESSGFSHSAVSKKLGMAGIEPVSMEGRNKIFHAPQALRVLLGGSELDPAAERARLDRVRSESQEFDLSVKKGEVVPAQSLETALITLTTVAAGALQALGRRLAVELAAETDRARCQKLVDDGVEEALSEIADRAAEATERLAALSDQEGSAGNRQVAGGDETSAEEDDPRVGGGVPGGSEGDKPEGWALEE